MRRRSSFIPAPHLLDSDAWPDPDQIAHVLDLGHSGAHGLAGFLSILFGGFVLFFPRAGRARAGLAHRGACDRDRHPAPRRRLKPAQAWRAPQTRRGTPERTVFLTCAPRPAERQERDISAQGRGRSRLRGPHTLRMVCLMKRIKT
jgi:hypothetical protein